MLHGVLVRHQSNEMKRNLPDFQSLPRAKDQKAPASCKQAPDNVNAVKEVIDEESKRKRKRIRKNQMNTSKDIVNLGVQMFQ